MHKKLLLVVLLACMAAPRPVFADPATDPGTATEAPAEDTEAPTEETTEELPEEASGEEGSSEETGIADMLVQENAEETNTASGTIAEQLAANTTPPEPVKLVLEYKFEDGSVDPWAEVFATPVGSGAYLASQPLPEQGSTQLKAIRDQKAPLYKTVGIDLPESDIPELAIHLDSDEELLLAAFKSDLALYGSDSDGAPLVITDVEAAAGDVVSAYIESDGVVTVSDVTIAGVDKSGNLRFNSQGESPIPGSMLFNDLGVVGLVEGNGKSSGSAVGAKTIMSGLEAAGIPFVISEAPAEEEEEQETTGNDFDNYNARRALEKAGELDLSLYTDDSVTAVETAKDAVEAELKSPKSQESLDAAAADLERAMDELVAKKKNIPLLPLIVLGAAIAALAVFAVLLLKKPKQKIQAAKEENDYEDDFDDEAGTEVLMEKDGPYLIRINNKEKIQLSRPAFVIGKEKKRVDYWVSDNPTVSRTHCRITKKDGRVYVEDLHSRNNTFVNDEQVFPGDKTRLMEGDILKISSEEFEYHQDN